MFGRMTDAEVAKIILRGLGNKENIDSLESCFTRLRVGVKNLDKVNNEVLKEAGALDIVVVDENNVQVVMGTKAPKILEVLNSGDKSQTLSTKEEKIIEALGKKENIDSLESCFTRLRVGVKNLDKVNNNALKELGALDVVVVDENNVQVVMGTKAPKILDELKKLI
ncbi:glucose PTS transporter subunit EIIB [Streptobacillus felis]|uniref:PTS transporter subunit EIIB n=1 Tax=Streptobacillus felis TaxID=1384509 RepID=A0A7Z0PFB3_9FUSO|nr:glucose PTS transporter subunit EIIB [Streptobacillus felis]NYV27512.1 PTS transporter subunit EIIB [Streptobacillus felis]